MATIFADTPGWRVPGFVVWHALQCEALGAQEAQLGRQAQSSYAREAVTLSGICPDCRSVHEILPNSSATQARVPLPEGMDPQAYVDHLVGVARSCRKHIYTKTPGEGTFPLDEGRIRILLEKYVELASRRLGDHDAQRLRRALEEFLPMCRVHMHLYARLHKASDTRVVSQESVDALIVTFINVACLPVEIGFSTVKLVYPLT